MSSFNPDELEALCDEIGKIQHLTKIVGTNISDENDRAS